MMYDMACPTWEWSYGVIPQTYILSSSSRCGTSSARRDIVLYRRSVIRLFFYRPFRLRPILHLLQPRLEFGDARFEALDDVPLGVRQTQDCVVAGVGEGDDVAGNADDGGVGRHV